MHLEQIKWLRCPSCRGPLEISGIAGVGDEFLEGDLECRSEGIRYPVRNGIPRFVPPENYATGFGFQWNEFRRTQLDSYTGLPLSRNRLLKSTGLAAESFSGKRVLDVGCGAGRFSEIALSLGATVVALDYSSAVDACRDNLGPHPRLCVVQGDIFHLPFEPGQFDIVYCLGVLQHTPDVRGAFMSLPEQVRPGGLLVADVYPKLFLNLLWPKYWMRPVTRRMSRERLFHLVKWMIKYLLPLSLFIGRIPVVGRKLRYAVPVANHEPDWPLSPALVREWAVLNTFDMLAPVHDYPQTDGTLRGWFEEAGMTQVELFRDGFYVARGRRKP